ncbi:hypothetical protein K0M31_018666, partial [Melipona bicolor]
MAQVFEESADDLALCATLANSPVVGTNAVCPPARPLEKEKNRAAEKTVRGGGKETARNEEGSVYRGTGTGVWSTGVGRGGFRSPWRQATPGTHGARRRGWSKRVAQGVCRA